MRNKGPAEEMEKLEYLVNKNMRQFGVAHEI